MTKTLDARYEISATRFVRDMAIVLVGITLVGCGNGDRDTKNGTCNGERTSSQGAVPRAAAPAMLAHKKTRSALDIDHLGAATRNAGTYLNLHLRIERGELLSTNDLHALINATDDIVGLCNQLWTKYVTSPHHAEVYETFLAMAETQLVAAAGPIDYLCRLAQAKPSREHLRKRILTAAATMEKPRREDYSSDDEYDDELVSYREFFVACAQLDHGKAGDYYLKSCLPERECDVTYKLWAAQSLDRARAIPLLQEIVETPDDELARVGRTDSDIVRELLIQRNRDSKERARYLLKEALSH